MNDSEKPDGDFSLQDAFELFDRLFKPSTMGGSEKTKLVSLSAKLRERGWKPGAVAGWNKAEVQQNYGILARAGLRGKTLPLACVVVELAANRAPDTVRGIMYAVVSAGWLPDTTDKSYGRVQRILNSLRKRRIIPFNWITDNVRNTIKPSSWSGLADFATTVRDAYRMDFWAKLPEYVAIIVEKDAVAGRIAQITEDYDVPLHPLRGYSSTSFTYSIAESWDRIDKPIACYYIGDHDPSGRDIERAIVAELKDYVKREFRWTRLAVTPAQFKKYKIKPLAPKKQDRRYHAFKARYGDRCAEVEAIPAPALRAMVREAIESHIPQAKWRRLKKIEATERASWNEVMDNMGVD
jgi:hypothetical protein